MPEPQASHPAKRSPLRLRNKIFAYVAVWIIALLVTGPGFWPLAYLFPLGLVAVFSQQLANDGGWGIFIGCYLAYVVQAFFYFRSKTLIATVLLYAVLVLMLIGNVAGCHQMNHSH